MANCKKIFYICKKRKRRERNNYEVKDLLAQSLITNDFLCQIDMARKQGANMTASEFCRNQLKQYDDDYESIGLYNPGFILGSLFITVVMLKEDMYEKIPNSVQVEDIGVESIKTTLNLKTFVRRIRNSLSHGNVTIYHDYSVYLFDENPHDKSDVFEIKLSFEQLYDFNKKWCMFYAMKYGNSKNE